MPLDVAAIRREFPIFERKINGNRLVFLDSAASSQKPRAVIDAMMHVYTHSYANVHRGLYSLAEEATEAYESAREKIARFINAPDTAEVINVRNATEGLNLVTHTWGEANVQEGDRIVITEMEHHANLVRGSNWRCANTPNWPTCPSTTTASSTSMRSRRCWRMDARKLSPVR